MERIVREKECRALTGLSRTTRFDLERAGRFPRRIRLSARSVGWFESDVLEWMKSRRQAGVEKRAA
ncbi:MAG: AlpA family phage regulatory protein [Vicinamibacteria bacterium]|nr:AlpA family phage regulatory protein [Vicinamibacteria bacterium]